MQRRRVRRDRHGRGLRGPLAPATSPLTVPRAESFGDLVVAAVDRLEPRWGALLDSVDVGVLDVPPTPAGAGEVVLAEHRSGPGPRRVTLVLYRRPLELRAPERRERRALVRAVVAEELAEALGIPPEDLDPAYDEDD